MIRHLLCRLGFHSMWLPSWDDFSTCRFCTYKRLEY